MKYVFIINPKAGKCNVEDMQNKINEVFREYDYVIEVSKKAKDATLIAKRYAQTNLDLCVFASGGDGTINEVVSGIYEYPNVKLAMIPTGTGNDFIKYFDNLKKDDFLSIKNYVNPIEISCDLIKIGPYVSINIASVGLDVDVAKNVNHFKHIPLIKGVVPYYLSIFYSLLLSSTYSFSMIIDGKRFSKDAYSFVVIGNAKYYGGGFIPSPNALIDDGLLDICLIKKLSRRKMISLIGKYKKGEHIQYKSLVTNIQCKKIQILSDDVIALNIDGEIVNIINPSFEVLNHKIKICLPNKG